MSIYKVIEITRHLVLFTGSQAECKAFKRKHFDQFYTRIIFSGDTE